MTNKKLLLFVILLCLLSCEYRSPEPQEYFSIEFKSNEILKFEHIFTRFMETQNFHKATALSDSKNNYKLTGKNKGAIIFVNGVNSYIMINNIINAKC
ncbi:MAG TPA: hypothetical protein ENJ60_14325 [Aeromonadales bacterium]|nr:hypothetical protein [Aeromonadales bacterium]